MIICTLYNLIDLSTKMADSEAKKAERGVESITDYVEEKEIENSDKVKESLTGLGDLSNQNK